MRRLLLYGSALLLISMISGCSGVPSGVLPKEKMAQLLADMHTAEAAIEINRSSFMVDTAKMAVRQAVYERHGVDQLTVDSSLVWYGRNIGKYMDVYDRTIEILDHRIIETGNRMAAEAALSIAGDSVDVWPGARFLHLTDRSPSSMLTFSFPHDLNWENGDSYTWRAKFLNNENDANWGIATEYSDGSVEYYHTSFHGDGWNEIVFATDSNKVATRIYGYLALDRRPGSAMALDSIAMVRKRSNSEIAMRRYLYRKLRQWNPPKEVEVSLPTDSTSVNTDSEQ